MADSGVRGGDAKERTDRAPGRRSSSRRRMEEEREWGGGGASRQWGKEIRGT